jgi:TetR/AcrR family transcriptional regulator
MQTRIRPKTASGKIPMMPDKFMNAKVSFKKLNSDKQNKIISACIDEFAEEGFDTASTNRIAQRAGVAKGSIFKYFGTKEKMFFFVINYLLVNYLNEVIKLLPGMPKGVLERYIVFMDGTVDFFGGDMKMYRAFSRIMSERGGEMMQKIKNDWQPYLEPLMKEMMAGSDMDRLNITPAEFVTIFGWLDNAIDMEVMGSIGPKTTRNDLKNMYRSRLELIFKVLKNGIYR